ncbi:MAG: 6,7-dimethyl-8-ribityllumazine synthase [Acidimicrobiia bacterium]
MPAPAIGGTALRVALLCARFNSHVTVRLLEGARRGLERCGSTAEVTEWVAGAFELPLAAQVVAASGRVDAVVCLGCVIRGETAHFDYVAGQCASGLQQVQLGTGVPVGFGVLTTEDLDQALARSLGPGHHNAGEQAVFAAVEMTLLARRFRS